MNPALRKLGYGPDDRVVVVHADDVGMCAATVDAFFDVFDDGLTSAGSAMVPCPAFPHVAAKARDRDDVDLGIHLTLTSEWDEYRWAPLTTSDPATGLVDDEGCFFRSPQHWRTVDPDAARAEMDAQIKAALGAGVDVTHVDCHMFAVLEQGLAPHYVDVARSHGVPALLTRQPQWVEALSEQALATWEDAGMPVFDHLREMPLDIATLFDELPPGLTYLVTHPAADTPELRTIATDWRQRVADYETSGRADLVDHVRDIGVHVIGWRRLKELIA